MPELALLQSSACFDNADYRSTADGSVPRQPWGLSVAERIFSLRLRQTYHSFALSCLLCPWCNRHTLYILCETQKRTAYKGTHAPSNVGCKMKHCNVYYFIVPNLGACYVWNFIINLNGLNCQDFFLNDVLRFVNPLSIDDFGVYLSLRFWSCQGRLCRLFTLDKDINALHLLSGQGSCLDPCPFGEKRVWAAPTLVYGSR